MSLVSDLLAKVKHQGEKRDIPPALREDVLRSSRQKQARRKWMVLGLGALATAAVSVGAVQVWEFYAPPPPGVQSPQVLAQLAPTVQGELPEPGAKTESPAASAPASPPARPTGVATAEPAAAAAAADATPQTLETPGPRGSDAVAGKQGASPASSASKAGAIGEPGRESPAKPGNRAPVETGKKATTDRLHPGAAEPLSPGTVRESRPAVVAGTRAEKAARPAEVTGSIQRERPEPKGNPGKASRRDKDLYLYKASSYEAENNWHQALANYQKVLEMEPRNIMVLNNVAGILLHLGSYEEAGKFAEKALAIKARHVPALINLGIASLQIGRESAGEDCLRQALSIEPSNSPALMNLGILYEKQGAPDKAWGVYSRLAEKGEARGYLGLGRIAEHQGRSTDAIASYKAVLALEKTTAKERAVANDRLTLLMR
jgi:tetratricopeptide (TPR) repeat protein